MIGDKIPRAEKKIEAVNRLKAMNVSPVIIDNFENKDMVTLCDNYSKTIEPVEGIIEDMIRKFEVEHNSLVFLAIYMYLDVSPFETFSLLSLVFVSDYREDWAYEKADLTDGYALTYTINLTDNELSEMGSIRFELKDGIPVRTH